MRRSLLAPALIFFFVACHLGMQVRDFEPARAPEGVAVEAWVERGKASGGEPKVRGELLEVREGGLLLLSPRPADTERRVVLLPFTLIRRARFDGLPGSCNLRNGEAPGEAVRGCIRRVSRFPQGLSPELLRLLLEAQGQTEPERLER